METAIIEALKCCIEDKCRDCPYSRLAQSGVCLNELHKDILDLLTKVHISVSELIEILQRKMKGVSCRNG